MRARGRARAYTSTDVPRAALPRHLTHLRLLDALAPSFICSVNLSSNQILISPPAFPPLYTTPPERTSSGPLRLLLFEQDPIHQSLLHSIQKEMAGLTDAVSQQKVPLNSSQNAREEETISHRAMVSALDSL